MSMSIQRYWVPNGTLTDQSGWHQDDNEVVLASEHDRELSALREELAQLRDDLKAQRNHYRAELADAGQRNDAYVQLLERMLRDDDMPVHWFAQSIDELLSKPTESGASE